MACHRRSALSGHRRPSAGPRLMRPDAYELVLGGVRTAAGQTFDIGLADGSIRSLVPAGTLTEGPRLELDGALVLPGLVDGHIHLDKTLLGLPWIPHVPGG